MVCMSSGSRRRASTAASTSSLLLEDDKDADDNRAISELGADHPLDEVELELVKVFAQRLQITLGSNAREIKLLERVGDPFCLLRREATLLKLADEFVGISYNKTVHTLCSIRIDM